MRHPLFWGWMLGLATFYVYDHFAGSPKLNLGRFKK